MMKPVRLPLKRNKRVSFCRWSITALLVLILYGYLPVRGQSKTIEYLLTYFGGENTEMPSQIEDTDYFRYFAKENEKFILMTGHYSLLTLNIGMSLSRQWVGVKDLAFPVWKHSSGLYLSLLSSSRLLVSFTNPESYLSNLIDGKILDSDSLYYEYLEDDTAHLVNVETGSSIISEMIGLQMDLPFNSIFVKKTGDLPFSLQLGLKAESENAARGLDVIYRMYLLQMRLSGAGNSLEEQLMNKKPGKDGKTLCVTLEDITFDNLKEWGILK